MSQPEKRSLDGISVEGDYHSFAYIHSIPIVDAKGRHLTSQEYLIGLAMRNLHSFDIRLTNKHAYWIFSGINLNQPLQTTVQEVVQRSAEVVEAVNRQRTRRKAIK